MTSNAPGSYLTGLVGSGIGPSLSPPLHEREADRHGLRLLYRTIDLEALPWPPGLRVPGGGTGGIPDGGTGDGGADVPGGGAGPGLAAGRLLHAARTVGFDGLNITHPCKQSVVPHLDELSSEAAELGAVNTVVLRAGTAVGHNTDVTGFRKSFTRGLPGAPLRRVVQLGAGGAGAAVSHALLGLGTDRLVVVDTDTDRAGRLAASLAGRFGEDRVTAAGRSVLEGELAGADGLVNATPVGMAAHPGTPVPEGFLHPGLWVAEVVYRPLETELLRRARRIGCRTLDGGAMAAFQAADAFRLFTGLEPHTGRMLQDLADLVGAPAGAARG
ncbi:shikimate dehydrogenase (NADP(+)) [Streptomyces daqingensis]|uniref:Shikimate dehydrogenase (NADP(+)) n=1 Tax=Streptomyces daqingensis TaxID=1472640 RepID=A0ABQ2MF01_9ACTN|nr:shikimate dehydrogenase [Streptomyces daqingensis]GGO50572.1 shikimate dehydrogenase (NADP(+)) [Streptomyces daqingensis]